MTKPRRILRMTGAGAVALALASAGLANATHSPASAVEPGVGEPRLALLESAHATGKTAVIGEGDLPVTSRAIAADPAEVLAQAIAVYPVDGAADEYVLANADGDVLALASESGGLTLRDIDPDEAAGDPLATWTLPARDGRVMVVGGGSALNLFGWNTADGAEIGTYAAGDFGNNESWFLHELRGEAVTVGALVAPGGAPAFPGTVPARYSWGPAVALSDIAWEAPSDDVWQRDGVVEFVGTAEGLFGEDVEIPARYTVGTIGDAVEQTMTSYAGASVAVLQQNAPRSVERAVSGSDLTVTADVRWDWSSVSSEDLAHEGEITVSAVRDLGFAATLRVRLVAPVETNQLREGVRTGQLHVDGDADLRALVNGDRDTVAFSDWRGGGAENRVNPNWVAFYFERPRELTRAAIFEPAGADNVGAVTFQYRNMIGGWEDVSTGRVANDGARLALEVDFDPVRATGFRAVFENKSDGTWMTLSEIEAWGPGL